MTDNQEKNPQTPNYFVIIPSHVLDDPRVDDATAILYGRISSLTNNKGYCYASDQYLADLTKTKIRTLQYRLKTLKDCGYLIVDTKKKGLFWDRKIYLNFNYETHDIASRNAPHCVIETSPIAEEQYKRTNKIIEPPNPLKKGDVDVLSFGEDQNVKMTQIEYDNLKEKLGSQTLNELIEELNDYIASHGKKYKSHSAAIRQWHRKRLRQEKDNLVTPKRRNFTSDNIHSAPELPKFVADCKYVTPQKNKEWAKAQVQRKGIRDDQVLFQETQVLIKIDGMWKPIPYDHKAFSPEFKDLTEEAGITKWLRG